jgi:hypothetical protein
MFERVLLSIPMEQFPELAIKRAKDLSERMGSSIFISYVIEDNVFDKVSQQSKHVITDIDQKRWEKKMIRSHQRRAEEVVMLEVKETLGDSVEGLYVKKGNYYHSLKRTIQEIEANLLILEYRYFDLMKYRIMDRSPIPVWIERNKGPIEKIGLFCTNLAPNRKSPNTARKLARKFDAELDTFYIEDPEGPDPNDETENISKKHGIQWNDIVSERVDSYITEKTRERTYDLIILGRIKKRGYFHLRSNFAKRSDASVLLVN